MDASVRWTLAETSANTGFYFYFSFPLRERKMQIESCCSLSSKEKVWAYPVAHFLRRRNCIPGPVARFLRRRNLGYILSPAFFEEALIGMSSCGCITLNFQHFPHTYPSKFTVSHTNGHQSVAAMLSFLNYLKGASATGNESLPLRIPSKGYLRAGAGSFSFSALYLKHLKI